MWNRFASKMPHIHFYVAGRIVPIPCPYVVDRFIGPDGFWRFSFDS
jgi:hypothetical protein